MIQKLIKIYFIHTLAFYSIILTLRCNRAPDGPGAFKTPADGRFRIKILDNVSKYIPGTTYTIGLEGTDTGARVMPSGKHKFSAFMLVVMHTEDELMDYTNPTSGIFSLSQGDIFSKIICANMVTQATTTPKQGIQALWTAPQPGTGCVQFRATVIEHRDVWYMDDGPLTKEFCEDEQLVDDLEMINDECCACSEAKYELTFEGKWSRNTHPKDFPTNSWMTRFSDLIGASHNNDYRIWLHGDKASDGVRQVAEHGVTKTLEAELKEKSENIRTIIKARGLSYPNVTGKTFAVFRVDPKRHLVSVISMIDPSPDWFVGVSGLELCLANCTWIERKTIELYPWDAGTDAGPSYMSVDQPIISPDNIRRIKSDFPNDPRSPFYDENGVKMKPIALLFLLRQRLYEKECVVSSNEQGDNNANDCATTGWSKWTRCDASCGKGFRYKQRTYVNPRLANRVGCKKDLTKREECYENQPNCNDNAGGDDDDDDGRNGGGGGGNSDDNFEDATEPECALTQWTEWSECKPKCGKGTQFQERRYLYKVGKKRCEGPGHHPVLRRERDCTTTYEDCIGDIVTENIDQQLTETAVDDHDNDDDDVDDQHPPVATSGNSRNKCKYSRWQSGPCSVSCGRGIKIKIQKPTDESADNCPNIEKSVPCQKKKCKIPEFCFDDPEMGNCKNSTNQWFFNRNTTQCSIFVWSCSNHGNKFTTLDECLDVCGGPSILDNTIND